MFEKKYLLSLLYFMTDMNAKNAKVLYFCRTVHDRIFVWFGNAADPHIHRCMCYGSIRKNHCGNPYTS
jgi:hypothetical protein